MRAISILSDFILTICFEHKDPLVSKRRYDWIEYENGRILGNKKSCLRVSKVDSWWRWLFWHCSFCFCLCDDATNSDRYFSLRSVLSTTNSNK